MKLSCEMLQYLPNFWNKKTQIFFFIFHSEEVWTFNSGCPGLCRYRPRASTAKNAKVARNEKHLGCHIPKILQILKRFTRQFHQA